MSLSITPFTNGDAEVQDVSPTVCPRELLVNNLLTYLQFQVTLGWDDPIMRIVKLQKKSSNKKTSL